MTHEKRTHAIGRPSKPLRISYGMTRDAFELQSADWHARTGNAYVLTGVEWCEGRLTLTFGPAQQFVTIMTPRLPWWRRCVERIKVAWAGSRLRKLVCW